MKLFVAGHNGMVGSSVIRAINNNPKKYKLYVADKNQLDLKNQREVQDFFCDNKFDHVVLAAAKVGGIHANNSYPADFIFDNLQIQSNVIHSSYLSKVKKLVFLGSSCIYPKNAVQPIKESELLSGKLEKTNEAYALAKISGLKMCEYYNKQYGTDFRSLMPTNLYGQNDNFNLENSHVLPALIRKFDDAKVNRRSEVEIWGSGKPKREFLHVDDLARAILFLLECDQDTLKYALDEGIGHINVGTGKDLEISKLAKLVADIVGFSGELKFNTNKPDGTMRKVLDVSKIHSLGWKHSIEIEQGIKDTYEWYKTNADGLRF